MSNWQKSLISLIFLAIMLAVGFKQTQAPAARSGTGLDYTALAKHVRAIAAKPHPMGSAANRDVRDYIVAYFESLGLATEVQQTTVVYRHPSRPAERTIIANIENIIARLPGKSPQAAGQARDLALMAHYDSRPLTPGAADDASGTASVLEVARLMIAGPTPVHDVIFLITDGEEMGLLGAQGFFRQHPAAARVGMVLDFEARGSYGASSMFETSENNDWLIGHLIESVPDLVASSLSYEIYRRMPNDTDMSISKGEGIPGLNFAFVSGLFDYHAMTDTPANLDRNTLAQHANYALAATRYFANLQAWQSGLKDVTYFNLWQGTLVSYSQNLAVVFGLLVLVFGIGVFAVAVRAGTVTAGSLGSGFLGLLVLILIISNLFESMIDYQKTADAGISRLLSLGEWPLLVYFVIVLGISAWFSAAIKRGFKLIEVLLPVLALALLGLMAARPWLGIAIFILIVIPPMLFLGRRKQVPDLWGAALIMWWLMTAVALYFAPNASYLLAWPLVAVLLWFVVQRRKKLTIAGGGVIATLTGSFVPLLLLPPMVIMAYLALGSSLPQVIMIISVLCMLLIWPLIQNVGSGNNGKPGLVLLVAGLVMLLIVVFERGFDARHPRGESLFYAIDVDQNKAYWVSPDARPGSWLDEFLGENAETANMTWILPGYDEDVLRREDGASRVEAATLELTGDRLVGGQREISLHLTSPARAGYVNLLLPADVGISSAMANGFAVDVPKARSGGMSVADRPDANKSQDKAREPDWWRWRWYGLPEQGADVVLTITPNRSLSVKIIEVDYGLPESAPPRPKASMATKYSWSDSRVIFQTRVLE